MPTPTYLIAYGENPNDRLTAYAFGSRRRANQVIDALPDVQHLIATEADAATELPGRALVEVYNGLTGAAVTRFATREAGTKRLLEVLPRVARPYEAQGVAPDPGPRRQRGARRRTRVNADSYEVVNGQRRFSDPSDARGKGIELRDQDRVRVLVNENPKKGTSKAAQRFANYRNGMTVAEAVEVGLTRNDLRWDIAHGYIQLAG
jgi:hypothetical protein